MNRIARLLGAVRRLHEASPALLRYAPWPDDLSPQQVLPRDCVAATTISTRSIPGTRATAPVIRAFRAAAPDLEWRQTYTVDEVGQRFLDDYGYVELFGPSGHYRSARLRGYLAYWGPDLTYDWHAHEAEELYFTLGGRAVFSARGSANAMLRAGEARDHTTNQPHMMITLDHCYLAYILWRGAGLEGLPRMGTT